MFKDKILIVDDEQLIRRTLAEALRGLGLRAHQGRDRRECSGDMHLHAPKQK
jgi:CheY-like chemotaxis protein